MLDATDTTTTTGAATETAAPATTEKKKPVPRTTPRTTHTIDAAAGTLTMHEPGKPDVVMTLAEVPAALHPRLILSGVWNTIRQTTETTKAWAAIKAGAMPGRPSSAPKEPELSPHRQALVAAKMEHSKKEGTPMEEADAKAWAKSLSRGEVDEKMKHPLSVKWFHKIKGTTPTL